MSFIGERSHDDTAFAKSLANDDSRTAAVASIVASRRPTVPVLPSWAKEPPKGVDCRLYTGLAEAFGELRTEGAIPFVVKNLAFTARALAWHRCSTSRPLSSGTFPRWEH